MTIYRAIKSNIHTQGYYDNKLDIYKKWDMKWHGGNDWAGKDEEPLYFDCSISGFVLNTELDNNGGLGINIITEEGENILKHRYWHLKKFNVVAGQKVESGDLIGWIDNTGYSTGTHLHRDVKQMTKENGVYKIKYPNNGSFGTVDFSSIFKNIFIRDYMDTLIIQIGLLQKLLNAVNALIEKLKGRQIK